MGSLNIRFKIIKRDDIEFIEEIHEVMVHRFNLSDVEDPDSYAAVQIWKWQQSDAGKFVIEHAVGKFEWHRHIDHMVRGYRYIIIAELEKKKLSEFYLKWGNPKV